MTDLGNRAEAPVTLYLIKVTGCDESTSVHIKLTGEQYQTAVMIADRINAASSYSCMPTMTILESSGEPSDD